MPPGPWMTPATTATANARAVMKFVTQQASRRWRLSMRSAKYPPMGLNIKEGMRAAKVIIPIQVAESVIW